jgi:hypothetical protein
MARDLEVISAITAHANAVDPHAQYFLQSEGDERYRRNAVALTDSDIPSGIARDIEFQAADTAHLAAADPHLQYPTQARGDARYTRKYEQRFKCAPTASQALPSSQLTKIIGTEILDIGNQFANGRLTALENETWQLNTYITFELPTSGRIILYMYKNGSPFERLADVTSTFFFGTRASCTVELVAGQFIELWGVIYQSNSKVFGDASLEASWWAGNRIA